MSLLTSPAVGRQALSGAFADLLSYPHDSPLAAARRCAAVAGESSEEAGRLVEAFVSLAESAELGELQEAYTRTFDLDTLLRAEPTCHPYVGHYLFEGGVHKYRPDFLVRLTDGVLLVLEIKGQETPKDRTKREFMREWVEAVNGYGGFGQWRCNVSRSPSDVADVLARATGG